MQFNAVAIEMAANQPWYKYVGLTVQLSESTGSVHLLQQGAWRIRLFTVEHVAEVVKNLKDIKSGCRSSWFLLLKMYPGRHASSDLRRTFAWTVESSCKIREICYSSSYMTFEGENIWIQLCLLSLRLYWIDDHFKCAQKNRLSSGGES